MFALCFIFSLSLASTPPAEQTAHDNMIVPFTGLGVTLGKPPCEEVWTVCENDRVVALNLFGKLVGAFPDISGFSQLRNLSFVDGFEIDVTQSLATFSLLSTLRHFSAGPAVFAMNWQFSALPSTIGTDWPNLEVFILHHVRQFAQLPSSIANWSKLRVFKMIQTNDEPLQPVFALPTSLTTWNAIVQFVIWDTNVNPLQQIPSLGNKANLTDFDLRDNVPDVVNMLRFDQFNDDAIFNSANLRNFVLKNMPLCVGTIPSTLGHATSLVTVEIERTGITGGLPTNVGNLKSLERLSLEGDFTGILPTTIGGWKSARDIVLQDVHMSGTIPTQIGNLNRLRLFAVAQVNAFPKLSGTFPKQLASLAYKNLTNLIITNTLLNGKIPEPDFKQAPAKLKILVVAGNGFQCTLPSWMIESIPSIDVGLCVVTQNNFCQQPLPLQQADLTKCLYTIQHQPCLCNECPGERAQSCTDCNGVVSGSSSYDACDVCDGDSLSCADCNGVPNGSSVYDLCDICGGANLCVDCNGVAGGTAIYDQCDVCDGDGTSCVDCLGTPFGFRVYDSCDVCGGDGLTCHDCDNGTSGQFEIDLCGQCVNMTFPDYHPRCFDCQGTPNGALELDLCGVCNGTNSDCNPNEIGAGVIGTRVVVPCLIVFGALDIVLLIVYIILRRNSSAVLTPNVNSQYTFTVMEHTKPNPMAKFID